MSDKKNRIALLTGYIDKNRKDIAAGERLLAALEKHGKKMLDKNFFKQFEVTVDNDGRPWTYGEIYMANPVYDFEKARGVKRILFAHRGGYGHGEVETIGRDTATAIRCTREHVERWKGWIKSYEDEIRALNGIDEDAVIADLLAVWEKHGRPPSDFWRNVLDKYEVKYPEEMLKGGDDK